MSINGANRLGSNSLGEMLVFGARAGRAAAEYASQARRRRPTAVLAPGVRRGAAHRSRVPAQDRRRASSIATLREEMQKTMEAGAGIYRDARLAGRGGGPRSRELQERYQDDLDRGPQPDLQHGAASRRWSWASCSTSPRPSSTCALQREESRGAHQRTRFPQARRRAIPGAFAGVAERRRVAADRVSAGNDHPLAAGRAGLRRGKSTAMADTIIIEVARYSSRDDAEPHFQELSRFRCARTGWSSTR